MVGEMGRQGHADFVAVFTRMVAEGSSLDFRTVYMNTFRQVVNKCILSLWHF